jgi:hypothetical protein
MRSIHKIAAKKPHGKSHIGDMGIYGCILKWNLEKGDMSGDYTDSG